MAKVERRRTQVVVARGGDVPAAQSCMHSDQDFRHWTEVIRSPFWAFRKAGWLWGISLAGHCPNGNDGGLTQPTH